MKQSFSKIDLLNAEIKHIEEKIKKQKNLDLKLEQALKTQDFESIKSLILNDGADVNGYDSKNIPFLFYPIVKDDIELFNFMIENGAKVNIVDKQKNTPLIIACKVNCNIEFVKILLENYADPYKKNSKGKMALDFLDKTKLNQNKAKLIKEKMSIYESFESNEQ